MLISFQEVGNNFPFLFCDYCVSFEILRAKVLPETNFHFFCVCSCFFCVTWDMAIFFFQEGKTKKKTLLFLKFDLLLRALAWYFGRHLARKIWCQRAKQKRIKKEVKFSRVKKFAVTAKEKYRQKDWKNGHELQSFFRLSFNHSDLGVFGNAFFGLTAKRRNLFPEAKMFAFCNELGNFFLATVFPLSLSSPCPWKQKSYQPDEMLACFFPEERKVSPTNISRWMTLSKMICDFCKEYFFLEIHFWSFACQASNLTPLILARPRIFASLHRGVSTTPKDLISRGSQRLSILPYPHRQL